MKRNMLARRVEPINAWPTPLRRLALTMLVGNVIPMVGTAGIRVEELTIGAGTQPPQGPKSPPLAARRVDGAARRDRHRTRRRHERPR